MTLPQLAMLAAFAVIALGLGLILAACRVAGCADDQADQLTENLRHE